MTKRRGSQGSDSGRSGSSPVARRSTLGLPGFLFVGITVFLAVGAVNSQNNLLFWVFGVAVAGVIVSGVVSGSGLMSVRLKAHPVPDLEAGSPANLTYTLVSTNRRLSVFGLEIRETARAGNSAPLVDAAAGVSHLAPRTHQRATLRWTPANRGLHQLDRVAVESRFPFGLLIKTLEFSSPRSVLVHPPRLELRPMIFDTARASSSGTDPRRARAGSGSDFYSIREYTPGDPRRAIAWRPSARRGNLLVVERTEPRTRSVWVWVTPPQDPAGAVKPLDRSEAQAPNVTTERAFALALALVREGTRQRRSVGLWLPWAGVTIAPGSGRAFEQRAADALARIDLDALPTHANTASTQLTPPPGLSSADFLLIPLTAQHAETRAHPRQRTLDPQAPEDWLAPGATLPPALQPQPKRGRR